MPDIDHERCAQPRIIPAKAVQVEYPDFRPRVRNLSLSGAFIEDPRPVGRGRVIQLVFQIGDGKPIQAKAMVRRVEPEVGMGVEFIEMSPGDRSRLREFVGLTAQVERLQSF